MELYDFVGETAEPEVITEVVMGKKRKVLQRYEVGNRVYDIAWEAYLKVLKHRDPKQPEPVKPKDSELRLAFPPST